MLRDLAGDVVQATEEGTLVVFFSMADPQAVVTLNKLVRRQESGQDVLAVNVDGPVERARLRPWLAGHGMKQLRTAHDPNAELCVRLGVSCGEAVVVRYEGANRVQWHGLDTDRAPNRPPPVDEPSVLGALGLEPSHLPVVQHVAVVE
ncbi:MAG: hypothetical protein EP330_11610 [Deltaproteobacteria bacterium]|nr:MAG: hypothetical protein EP330_11610 [Deltaproteobacteria bacterium]